MIARCSVKDGTGNTGLVRAKLSLSTVNCACSINKVIVAILALSLYLLHANHTHVRVSAN